MGSLDPKKAHTLIQQLSSRLNGFEERQAQLDMLDTIIEAYNRDGICLVEAGTGTGKSIAYLIPALLWALQEKERTVISTNTINLQEQLINKDIPLLLKTLHIDLKVELIKGMGNYLCIRKLTDALEERQQLQDHESEELERIEAWCESTQDGSRSDLPFVPSYATWERVNAEADICTQHECPFYEECHFFKARKQASDAQILVVNHHLLFADLALRNETENYNNSAVLPSYQRIIIDEAHHIEDIATEYFASRTHYIGLNRLLAKLASERQNKAHGKLPILREKMVEQYRDSPPKEIQNILTRLHLDLPGIRREVTQCVSDNFNAYFDFMKTLTNSEHLDQESKLRLLKEHNTHPHWNQEVIPATTALITALYRYIQTIHGVTKDISDIKEESIVDKLKNTLSDITAYTSRLTSVCKVLEAFIKDEYSPNHVKWLEAQKLKTITNMHLVEAKLDLAEAMSDLLFKRYSSIVLCSATLTSNKDFSFYRNRLGINDTYLPEKHMTEAIYDSPFNYRDHTLLAIPTDICAPSAPTFTKEAMHHIWQAVQCSRGNAFILFTSYGMLKKCYDQLAPKMMEHRYFPLKQGDLSRDQLLTTFRTKDRSILFGTDSFWEGVDVVGEALRLVIIVRLPFQVPSEPIVQARTEAITEQGGNPFFDYSVPNAIVKFKQGFGRLIRNKNDRGCILCLDSRLQTKSYGRLFLNSLPPSKQVFAEEKTLYAQMEEFYKTTYRLAHKK